MEEPTGLYPRTNEVVVVPYSKFGGRQPAWRVVDAQGTELPWQATDSALLFPATLIPGELPEYRITAAPEIPTTKDAGYPNVNIGHWAGLFAPRGTPQAVIERMNAEVLATVKSREFQEKLVPSGIEPAPFTLAQYVEFIRNERERLGTIARRAKMQAD